MNPFSIYQEKSFSFENLHATALETELWNRPVIL